MDKQSLGQVAYEAYKEAAGGKSTVSGAALPHWSNVNPQTKEAWQFAAERLGMVVNDRRVEDQDKAVETAFIDGTLPEADRRRATEDVKAPAE